jgi:hypothetical protein
LGSMMQHSDFFLKVTVFRKASGCVRPDFVIVQVTDDLVIGVDIGKFFEETAEPGIEPADLFRF